MSEIGSILDWREYINSDVIKPALREELVRYGEKLESNDVPVIFEVGHLCAQMNITLPYLSSVVSAADNHYRTFSIPKKTGGTRQIDAPYPALLECQRWINKKILCKASISEHAHAYRSDASFLTNAESHLGQKVIFKTDLANFFPSVKLRRVVAIFRKFGYAPNIAFNLASMCTLNEALPQGAATSPSISNIIAKRLDLRLNGLARSQKLKYTRYSDDIVFSGAYVPAFFFSAVDQIIRSEGFVPNEAKTKLITGRSRVITGVSVATDTPKLPRATKRKTQQEVYEFFRQRNLEKFQTNGEFDPFKIERLMGKLSHWLRIEPGNKFASEKYAQLGSLRRSYLRPEQFDRQRVRYRTLEKWIPSSILAAASGLTTIAFTRLIDTLAILHQLSAYILRLVTTILRP